MTSVLTGSEIDALWTDDPSLPQKVKRRELVRLAIPAVIRKLAAAPDYEAMYKKGFKAFDCPVCGFEGALGFEPAQAAAEPVAWSEAAIDDYIAGYSLIGDEGDYTPTETERFLIKDAIVGFMSAEQAAAEPVTLGGGLPYDHNGVHTAELKALSILLRKLDGPVTLSAKKIPIADSIDAAIAALEKVKGPTP